MKEFISFDDFDQDNKFPHKSSRKVLAETDNLFQGILSVQPGMNVMIDNTDPDKPIINAASYVLSQATPIVLGGLS